MIPKYDLSNASDVEELYNMLDVAQAGLTINEDDESHTEIQNELEAVTVSLMVLLERLADED